MPPPPQVRCHIRALRDAAGLSQVALAQHAGISRQALAAIESSRAVPSTAVALALALALGRPVEALFALHSAGLEGAGRGHPPGTRLAVAQVGGRWVGHALGPTDPTPADALVGPGDRLEPLSSADRLGSAALVLGCAPLLGALAGHLAGHPGAGARWLHRPSGAALTALAQGRAHVAGLHLAAWDDPGAHDRLVRARLPGEALDIVSLVGWREGLCVAPGNPLGIGSIADLAAPGRRTARRAAGAGATLVLDRALAAAGLGDDALPGPLVSSHETAALAVLHGAADAAVLVEPVALAHGLAFLPLSEERFELVLRSRDRAHPGVARLLERLGGSPFAREVRSMGAYETAGMGDLRHLGAA